MHSFVPLTPTTFLERTGLAFADREAIIHAQKSYCFGDVLQRTRRLAQVLRDLGVAYGDRIGLVSENKLQTIEAHFAIPATGGVIVSINPWLPSKDIADQLAFCDAQILIISDHFLQKHKKIFETENDLKQVLVIDAESPSEFPYISDYEEVIKNASDKTPLDAEVRSETDAIAINFTSGTTGFPKGVVISHRAAYLHAIGQAMMLGLDSCSRYLWTLPMFHVNGWGHMWACVAIGATQIVLDSGTESDAEFIGDIRKHNITHLSGAPRLVRALAETPGASPVLRDLTVVTGGAAPSPLLIKQLEEMQVKLIHQYGLNETCGPYVVCEEQEEWKNLSLEDRTQLRMRQGVPCIHAGNGLRVVDSEMRNVPADGVTLGEVIMAGNTVATEYYNNKEASDKAFVDGWFHSGDMAVVYPDGYLQIKDRIKDLIYVETTYGWENISSIEVENTLCQFQGIKDAAVIGLTGTHESPDGSLLIAFLEKANNKKIDEEKLRHFCTLELAIYKQPHYFFFSELPKTATGKIKKDLLVLDAKNRIEKSALKKKQQAPLETETTEA